jgi:hypothetical protein
MMRRNGAFSLAAATVLMIASGVARAEMTKAQCIDANTKGQDFRRDGKLSAAREQLRACADPSCPGIVRDDCTRRLDEVERAQPTVAFEVRDAAGADVSAVTVTMDGKPLAEGLGGTALPVDIGAHVFAFTVAGQEPVVRTLLVTEGEKGRRERIVVGTTPSPSTERPAATGEPKAAPPAEEGRSSTAEPVPAGGSMTTQKVLGLVTGCAGLAGIAAGSVFGLMTLSEKSQQESDCASASACTDHTKAVSDHSTGLTDSTVSTAGFIAGGALLVGGAVLFFTAHSSDTSATTGLLVIPSLAPGGGGMSLRGGF